MCVIVYKPNDVAVPTKQILRQCWNRNKDGAGYAVLMEDDTWHVKKGFMSWKKFWKAFRAEEFKKEHAFVVHFRIKSAGAIVKGNTHPFPITDTYEEMQQLEYNAKHIVFHNGTCGVGDGSASDTMKYIKEVIDPLQPYLNDPKIVALLSSLLKETHDRWLITNGNTLTMYGTWVKENGLCFSNGYWKPIIQTVKQKVTKPIYPIYGGTSTYYSDEDYEVDISGTILPDGTIVPDEVEETETTDTIPMCPHCFEEHYLVESPFVGMGDTMCEICGCCFDEETMTKWMFDEDLKAEYDKKQKEKKDERRVPAK